MNGMDFSINSTEFSCAVSIIIGLDVLLLSSRGKPMNNLYPNSGRDRTVLVEGPAPVQSEHACTMRVNTRNGHTGTVFLNCLRFQSLLCNVDVYQHQHYNYTNRTHSHIGFQPCNAVNCPTRTYNYTYAEHVSSMHACTYGI